MIGPLIVVEQRANTRTESDRSTSQWAAVFSRLGTTYGKKRDKDFARRS